MGRDQNLGRRRLEANPALDAEDGVSDVNVAPHPVRPANFVERLDDLDPRTGFPVDGHRKSILKRNREGLRRIRRVGGGRGVRVGLFRQGGLRRQCLLSADRSAPQATVNGIVSRVVRDREPPFFEVGGRVRPAEAEATDGGDHVQVVPHELERHVEPHLVVAGAGGAVGNGRCADLLRDLGDGPGLHDALRPYAQRVDAALQDVALDQVAQVVVIERSPPVDEVVTVCAEAFCSGLDRRAVGVREAAGVDRDGVHRGVVGLLQVRNAEGGIEPSAEGENDGHVDKNSVANTKKALARENQRLRRGGGDAAVKWEVVPYSFDAWTPVRAVEGCSRRTRRARRRVVGAMRAGRRFMVAPTIPGTFGSVKPDRGQSSDEIVKGTAFIPQGRGRVH